MSNSTNVWTVVAGALLLGGIGAILYVRGAPPAGTQTTQPAPQQTPAPPAGPPNAAVAKTPPKAAPAAAPKAKKLVMPDGSELEPLNGVTEPAELSWPKQFPYSPVVDKIQDGRGVWWYVHADGSRSTTQLQKYPDGSLKPITVVSNPTTPTPVVEETADGKQKIIPVPKKKQ